MTKYAYVVFKTGEEETERNFLIALNSLGIITVSREDINEWYEDFKKDQYSRHDSFVLHNEEEVERFELMMKAFFPDKEYKITDNPGTPEFERWLKKHHRKDNGEFLFTDAP